VPVDDAVMVCVGEDVQVDVGVLVGVAPLDCEPVDDADCESVIEAVAVVEAVMDAVAVVVAVMDAVAEVVAVIVRVAVLLLVDEDDSVMDTELEKDSGIVSDAV